MYALLQQYGAAIVVSHSSRYPIPSEMVTAPFVYFRFHGPEAMFASPYGRQQIAEWAARIKSLLAQGRDVYAYFNNDSGGHAFRNAQALKALLDIDVTRD